MQESWQKMTFLLWMQSPNMNKSGFLGRGQSSFFPLSQDDEMITLGKTLWMTAENHEKSLQNVQLLHYLTLWFNPFLYTQP